MSTRLLSGPALLLLLLIAAQAFPGTTLACDAWATWCAWQRTWHTPYATNTPLRDYYVPRTPGRCQGAVYADGVGYAACGGVVVQSMDGPSANCGAYGAAPAQPCAFCDPCRFERLGQIPNDLEISIAAPSSAPTR